MISLDHQEIVGDLSDHQVIIFFVPSLLCRGDCVSNSEVVYSGVKL